MSGGSQLVDGWILLDIYQTHDHYHFIMDILSCAVLRAFGQAPDSKAENENENENEYPGHARSYSVDSHKIDCTGTSAPEQNPQALSQTLSSISLDLG